MSQNKHAWTLRNHHDLRSQSNQLTIWKFYNKTDEWLTAQKPSKWRKQKSMNCHCRTCKKWAILGREQRLKHQLRKKGMSTETIIYKDEYEGFDERPDIITNEEDWI